MRVASILRSVLAVSCTAFVLFAALGRAASGGPAIHVEVPPAQPLQRRPDIILVTIDALRKDHVSEYGYWRLTTPAIDRFSETAVRFTNAVTQAPYTKAAIASLMSGLYPSSHKAVTATVPFGDAMTGQPTTTPATTDILSPRIVTLAERLKAAGYRTLGLTGNPFLIAPFGFAQGFDVFEFFPGGDFADANQIVASALEQVRRSPGQPLFLWVHLMEPHSPYTPPPWTARAFPLTGSPDRVPASHPPPPWLLKGSPPDLRLYVEAYDEEILAADAAVDTLLRGFEEMRDLPHSVVAITADHGEQFLDHGGWEHNDTLYDELIRVPLVVRAPGERAGVVASQVEIVDLYPTLLDYADVPIPPDLPGRSLAAHPGRPLEPAPAFSEIAGAQYAVRTPDWKLIASSTGGAQLFDLRADARERRNVVAEQPGQADRLRRMLDHWLAAALERGADIGPERAPVDPRVLERLRALGYVGR